MSRIHSFALPDLKGVRVVTVRSIANGPRGKIPPGVDVTELAIGPDGKARWQNLRLLLARGYIHIFAKGGEDIAPAHVEQPKSGASAADDRLPLSEVQKLTSRKIRAYMQKHGIPEPGPYNVKNSELVDIIVEHQGVLPGDDDALPPVDDLLLEQSDDQDESEPEGV